MLFIFPFGIGDLLDIRTTISDFDKDEWHTMPVIDSIRKIKKG